MADFDDKSKKDEGTSSKKTNNDFFAKLLGFISRYKKNLIIAVGGLLVTAAIVIGAILIFSDNGSDKNEDVYTEPVLTLIDETDEETVVIDEDNEADYTSVGMIIADVKNADEIAEGFGRYADKLINEEKLLDKYFIYNSGSSANQQIQDTRALLSRGCKSIVLCGVSDDSYNIISGLCSAEGVALIGIESSEKCNVCVNASDAWYGGYVESVKAAKAPEDKLILVSDSENSEFTSSITAELEKEGITPDAVVFGSDKKFSDKLAEVCDADSFVLLAKGNYVSSALFTCLANYRIPKAVVTRANAGIIKDWYTLKNEGIVIAEAVEADEKHEAIPEERIASESAALYAYAGLDGKMLGCAACRFAFNYSQNKSLNDDCDYTVSSADVYTDADVETLYNEYSDYDNDYNIPGTIDFDEIDILFTESTENGI